MLNSKQRAELRAQANTLDPILHIGKGGITETLIKQATDALAARELVKGKVLETAGMTAREACDALCEATGADGVQAIGSVFVLYKKAPQDKSTGTAKARARKNPVRQGAQARRQAAKAERERRNEYFHEKAIQEAIERRRAREERG